MLRKHEITYEWLDEVITKLICMHNAEETVTDPLRRCCYLIISFDYFKVFKEGMNKMMIASGDNKQLTLGDESGWIYRGLEILIVHNKQNFLAVA